MATLNLQIQTPPARRQKVLSDSSNEVVIEEKRDDNLKELLIRMEKRMEKMEKRQVQIDGKLDCLVQYLKNEKGACGAAVKKEEMDGKFVVS
jgi:small-conductance mechanosensitive channel